MRAFENWIEDESNQDVVFTIKECIENPGMIPLFISGPPKVGKSHLASAIEQEYIKRYGFTTKRKTCKSFFLKWVSMEDPYEKSAFLREINVLIIDNFECVVDKNINFQEEFLKVIDWCLVFKHQIIFISRLPVEAYEKRLRDVLELGFCVEIHQAID